MFVFVMEPISHFIMSINVIFGPKAVKKIGPIQNELCQKDKKYNFRFFQSNGPTDYSLLIENAQLDDSGAYECQAHTATNRLRSQSARLEVLKPPSDVSMVPVPGSSGQYKSETVMISSKCPINSNSPVNH